MSTITVHLWAGLRHITGGEDKVTVEASTIGEMLDALVAAHPGLAPVLKAGVAVAVDDELVTGGRHKPVGPENEIYLLQQVKGG